MKHSIRINGEVKEIDCELGTGLFDKYGNEIFEGDKVKIFGADVYEVYQNNTDWRLDGYFFNLDDIIESGREIVVDY